MYTLTQQALSTAEAKARFRGLIDLELPEVELPDGCVPGLEVLLPSPTDTDIEAISTLFIWVPGATLADLRKLAAMPFEVENAETENLLRSESFAILGDKVGGIYIPMWSADAFSIWRGKQTVRLVLIGDESVMDVHHHFTGEDLELFEICGQVQMSTTGPNYSCGRRHSEETLNEVAHLGYDYCLLGRQVVLLQQAVAQ